MTNEEFLKTLPNEQMVKEIIEQYGEFIYANLMPSLNFWEIEVNATIDFYNWLKAEQSKVVIT